MSIEADSLKSHAVSPKAEGKLETSNLPPRNEVQFDFFAQENFAAERSALLGIFRVAAFFCLDITQRPRFKKQFP